MDGDELDAALEVCNSIEGFDTHESNKILLQRARNVQLEAFDRKDTSTWAQEDREKYCNLILQAAAETRNVSGSGGSVLSRTSMCHAHTTTRPSLLADQASEGVDPRREEARGGVVPHLRVPRPQRAPADGAACVPACRGGCGGGPAAGVCDGGRCSGRGEGSAAGDGGDIAGWW